ncbi:MAG TPA: glycosyltransferase [Planctomycetota bacterium]|nr:glycosyltransferase [Planctomycetota bacterium]
MSQRRASIPSSRRLSASSAAAPGTEALREAAPRKRFIHIGGLKLNKNLLPALEAFALIADAVPDWDFAIFSDEPPRANVRPEVEAFIRRRGLEERILLYPPTPEIFREYARSHAHVISSLSEGLPNCVAEAMRHALPSIGYDVCPGTNELIADGENGLLAEAADPVRSLAARMRALAEDDEERRRLGRKALADSAMFDRDAVMDNWTALLREAAGYRRDRARLRRERLGFDPAALRRAERVQRSAFLMAPAPEPAEGRPCALSVLLPPGSSGEDLQRLLRVLGRSRAEAEILLPEDGAAALQPGPASPAGVAIRCSSDPFSDDARLGAAGEYLLCLSPGLRGEAELKAATDFALRVRRQGADVGMTLPEHAGAPGGLTTLGRAGPALFAAAPVETVWKLSHLGAFGVPPDPHSSLAAALVATATAAAVLVETRPPQGEPASWSCHGKPGAVEAVGLRAMIAGRLEDASVEALCPVADAVLARTWVLPVLEDAFDRRRIDHDQADEIRGLASALRHGAPLLSETSLPEAVAVMTAALGYYPWVLPALRQQPLPSQILVAIEKALPLTTLSAGRGALTRRWSPIAA